MVKNWRMKNRIWPILLMLVSFFALALVGITSGLFNEASSEVKTGRVETKASVAAPVFSEESGFYAEPFYLNIAAPAGTKIYYTLDCTDPDEDSTEYEMPIYLEDATSHENVYSMNTDVSAGFYSDLIEAYQSTAEDPKYTPPDYLLDKCNVVRAVAIDKNGERSEVITKSYYVGMDASAFGNVGIVSVVTDPANLFDSQTGIYVTGNHFIKEQDKISQYTDWRTWEGNYWQKGKKWERDASITFFNSSGEVICEQQTGGIRVQGGWSRGAVPRSLNITLKGTDDINSAEFTPFETSYAPQKVTLACGGNRIFTKFSDYMISERCKELNFGVMHYSPYVLFLDGEYWGFYWLAEKYDEDFFAYYYGVDKDNVLMIKAGSVELGNEELLAVYYDMKETITSLNLSMDSDYKKACSIIDVDSFIDYYATMAYISRSGDWPRGNFALWRTIYSDESEYSDCRWRWLMYDCNSLAMEDFVLYDDSIDYLIKQDELFSAFWENSRFREQFQERLLEIAENCFDPDEMEQFIEEYDLTMRDILEKSWTRFHGKNNDKIDTYQAEMESFSVFFSGRKQVVESWLS